MTHPKQDSLLRKDDVWLRPPCGTKLLLPPVLPPPLQSLAGLTGATATSAEAADDKSSHVRLSAVSDLRRLRTAAPPRPGPGREDEVGLGWRPPAGPARGDGNLDPDPDPEADPPRAAGVAGLTWLDEELREGAQGG